MKFALTVFVCMLAVATAAPSTELFNAFQLEAAQSQYEQVLSMHSRIMAAFKPHQMRALGEVAAAAKEASQPEPLNPSIAKACKDAIKAIDDAKNATACKAFDKFDPEHATPAQYASICESSCYSGVQAALAAAGTACASNATDMGVRNRLNGIKSEITGLCLKDGNDYCMSKFINATGEIGKLSKTKKGSYTIAEAQLNQLCSPCSQKVMAAVAANGDAMGDMQGAANTFKLLCVKDQGKYCYPQVADMDTKSTTGTVNYEAICSPCFRKYAIGSGEFSADTFNQYGQFCFRDDKGKLCLEKYADFGMAAAAVLLSSDCITAVAQAAANGQAVSDICQVGACSSAMNKVVSDMGCCFGTLIKFQAKEKSGGAASSTGGAAPAQPVAPAGPVGPDSAMPMPEPVLPAPRPNAKATEASTPEAIAKTFCLSSVPAGCSGSSKNVKLTFTIPNLSWSWYTASTANKQKADDAVRQDLAAAAGVVPSAVTLTSKQATTTAAAKFRFMATSSGVTYDSTIAVDTTAQADFVTNDVKSQASAGTLSFSTTASSLPTESKNNAAQSYEVSSVTAETTSSGTGAASSLSVSIFSIVAVFIAIVMNRA